MAIEYTEIEIPVSELQLGMHVVRLDRPWTETDFLMQGFIVDGNDVIAALTSQCKFVYIQGKSFSQYEHANHAVLQSQKTKKGLFSRKGASPEPINQTHRVVADRPPQGKNKISYINKISTEKALPQAKAAYRSAKVTVSNIMAGIRIGRMIDMNEARTTVNHIVDGLLQNKDALTWLTKIKDKDEYTAEHSLNVSILSATFARHLGHDEEDIRKIALGGLLHDVGKAKIPTEILNKEGRFTDEEFDIMKQHSVFGRNLLMSMPEKDHFVIDIAHSHHERMDGLGYPRKLEASQIPYFAKVVAIVDAYDAITSSRCYDKGRSSMEALDVIYKCKDTQFDGDLVLEFIKCIGIYPPGAIVELTNNEVGIVIETHEKNKLKPRVLVVLDQDKKKSPQKVIDLNLNIENDVGEYLRISKELINGTYGIWLEEYIKQGLMLSK